MGTRWSIVVLVLALLPATASAANHVVTAQSNFTFSPNNLTIDAGDTVTFQNGGGFHNVTSDPGSVTTFRCANGCDGAGGNGNLSGASWSATVSFPTAGTIGYFCEAHGSPGGVGMAGTITVVASAANLSVSDASVVEGNSGSKLAAFTISLSQASGSPVTYNVATANGTASAGSDYVASSVTGQSIPAGTTSRVFNVTINGDTTVEANETFNVNVSNVVGAMVADGVGVGTILNDDVIVEMPVAGPYDADFNGDGKSDILWRNSSTGVNAIWRSANSATQQPITAVANQAWKVVGIGDFNNDNVSDVLWRNSGTGVNAIWRSANSATQHPISAVANQAWRVVGVGDFDADGRSDVLWRNSSTGANAIWRSGNSATQQPITAVTNLAWKVVGVADFNGDGKSDILWRKDGVGTNAIWRSGNSAAQQPVAAIANLDWGVVGVGDFNGDGVSDILWRNRSTGANTIWRSANSALPITAQAVAWKVAMVGDFNADARSDVLWRNSSTGQNVAWLSASSATMQAVTTVANQQWKVVP
ncbi:MAG TPA: FG-GAP-like repeat-containing protein [Lysobacter sp.]